MADGDVKSRVKQVMALAFNVPEATIPDDAAQGSVASWDSIGQVNLMLGIEEEFNIQLTDDVMPTLNSLPAIVEYLSRQAV